MNPLEGNLYVAHQERYCLGAVVISTGGRDFFPQSITSLLSPCCSNPKCPMKCFYILNHLSSAGRITIQIRLQCKRSTENIRT